MVNYPTTRAVNTKRERWVLTLCKLRRPTLDTAITPWHRHLRGLHRKCFFICLYTYLSLSFPFISLCIFLLAALLKSGLFFSATKKPGTQWDSVGFGALTTARDKDLLSAPKTQVADITFCDLSNIKHALRLAAATVSSLCLLVEQNGIRAGPLGRPPLATQLACIPWAIHAS